MFSGSNFKSFCIGALLVVEVAQALTPDTASLASGRLFQILETIAEGGMPWLLSRLHVDCFTTYNGEFRPPNGSVPFEDRDEDCAPDEVCLASYQLGSELTVNEAGNSPESHHVRFDLALLSVRSGRPGSSYASELIPCSSALILSLCRMNC
jgi:hypothetical protein